MSYYTIFFKCSASIYEKTYYYLAGAGGGGVGYTHAGCFLLYKDVSLQNNTRLRTFFYCIWMYICKVLHPNAPFLHNIGGLIALCDIHNYSFLLHMNVSP